MPPFPLSLQLLALIVDLQGPFTDRVGRWTPNMAAVWVQLVALAGPITGEDGELTTSLPTYLEEVDPELLRSLLQGLWRTCGCWGG